MALFERISTLLRANLNDLIEKAEDPAKLLNQVVLDMENQLMQVKTQLAIAIADENQLRNRLTELQSATQEWRRKAELALDKNNEEMARAALLRAEQNDELAQAFQQQLTTQQAQVLELRRAFDQLTVKLRETRERKELLLTQYRRARVTHKANAARVAAQPEAASGAWERMRHKIRHSEALGQAHQELLQPALEEQFTNLEREERVERLLRELRQKRIAG